MPEDSSNQDKTDAKPSAPVLSDVRPVTSDTPVPEKNAEITMATPPNDDVMPDLASEASQPASSVTEHDAPAAPRAVDAIKKKSGMSMVIAIVVVVVLALSAVGYFAMKHKDTSTSESTAAKVDPSATSSTIDDSLSSLDQSKDFNSADLSDTSLGL